MRAIVADAQGQVRMKDLPAPRPAPGQVLIKAACSLISPGTELYYLEQAAINGKSRTLGYCSSGQVAGLGEQVEGLARGDRVIALGWDYAVHAEQICVPYRLCVKIPGKLPFDRAVFANLAATCLHAVHRARLAKRGRVLVLGAGLVGQLLAQIARRSGALVAVADYVPARLQAAARSGADAVFDSSLASWVSLAAQATQGRGFDTIFLCCSGEATATLAQCLETLTKAPDGQRRGVLVGVGRFRARVEFNVELGNLDIRYAARCGSGYRDDEYVHGRRDYPPPPGERAVDDNLRRCLTLIASGQINLDHLHTHRLPLSQAPGAYDLLRHPGQALGVTLHYD
ncbi:MAG: zinc-binding alcohol dehydrogenase [Thermodesulfobacteriota bacterium]